MASQHNRVANAYRKELSIALNTESSTPTGLLNDPSLIPLLCFEDLYENVLFINPFVNLFPVDRKLFCYPQFRRIGQWLDGQSISSQIGYTLTCPIITNHG